VKNVDPTNLVVWVCFKALNPNKHPNYCKQMTCKAEKHEKLEDVDKLVKSLFLKVRQQFFIDEVVEITLVFGNLEKLQKP